MKLLLDDNNVIISASNYGYYLKTDRVEVFDNGDLLFTMMSYNKYNSTLIYIDDDAVPANAIRRYKFIDGKFELIDKPLISSEQVAELILSDVPKEPDELYKEKKTESIIHFWKNINPNITNANRSLLEGIDYLSVDDSELSSEQIEQKEKAQRFINKLKARFRIEQEVGDVCDQVADVDKQLQFMTAMIARMYLLVVNLVNNSSITNEELEQIIPSGVKNDYDVFSQNFVGAIAAGQYMDRTDLEDPSELFNRLLGRNILKAQIVKDEYFDKKI